VSPDDYWAVEAGLLHELDLAFFEDRFEAMAREHGRVPLARLHGTLPDLSGLNLLVRRLVERGLVYRPTRGAYDFALPLLGDYLRRRVEVTKVTRRVTPQADSVEPARSTRGGGSGRTR
jgi:hypothetical protein